MMRTTRRNELPSILFDQLDDVTTVHLSSVVCYYTQIRSFVNKIVYKYTQKSVNYPFSLISRALSRCQSRFLMASRLSALCLPFARPSSILAMPRLLK